MLKVSSHLCLGLPSWLFPSGFQNTILYAFQIFSTYATSPGHLKLLDLITLLLPVLLLKFMAYLVRSILTSSTSVKHINIQILYEGRLPAYPQTPWPRGPWHSSSTGISSPPVQQRRPYQQLHHHIAFEINIMAKDSELKDSNNYPHLICSYLHTNFSNTHSIPQQLFNTFGSRIWIHVFAKTS